MYDVVSKKNAAIMHDVIPHLAACESKLVSPHDDGRDV